MRYKLYEAPSISSVYSKIRTGLDNLGNNFENKANKTSGINQTQGEKDRTAGLDAEDLEKRLQGLEKSNDYPGAYRAYRDLLKSPNINKVTEYIILDRIKDLFFRGFTDNWNYNEKKNCSDLFNDITASVRPEGEKLNGADYGLQQLGFWVYLIEAYKWEEILDKNNVFKQAVRMILNQNMNESLLNEATLAQALKINDFKGFQKLYNMYVRHELDDLKGLNDLISKFNSTDDRTSNRQIDNTKEQIENVLDMLDDTSDDTVKDVYNISKGILIKRGLNLS